VNGRDIRETFLGFFEARGHTRVRSSSLIAPAESGLLLTGAGMMQFIPYFLGQAEPPYPRATSAQKCFRAVDIENVGHTDRHLTMFEMLGNFSFGDYFKAESCAWGLELITEGYGLDPDRLWVSVYLDDDEAASIWLDLGIASDRIVRRGKADNYWWTHAAGPAGPSSEIFVDRGERFGVPGGPDADEDRFCEIWNHVFMQDQVDADCEVLGQLPRKNIDTGSSLERVAMVLQDKGSFFDTDLFTPLLDEVQAVSGKVYGADERHDVAIRIIGEHARSAAFLVADGVQPSNEGRGYILRRLLRRVVSAARQLGAEREVFRPLVARVVDGFGDAYPELRENRAFIEEVLASEEERFSSTLRQGMVLFEQAREHASDGVVSGDDAFKLSDTFGFPIELTAELAAEAGLTVDEGRFRALLQEQKDRARAAAKKVEVGLDTGAVPPTTFVGYEQPEAEAPISLLLGADNLERQVAEEGEAVRVFLDRTPFYAEGGGQVGDRGRIRTHTGTIRVTDTQKAGDTSIVHEGVVESGEVRAGQDAIAEIDRLLREGTARAHTSTHVVHATLRRILGDHARQAGSLIEPGRLRFDFSHPSAVPVEVLEEAELEANRHLAADDAVHIFETSIDEAKALGATALFGEKYGDRVRVVEIGRYSRELCGGTHVARTGNVAVIRLLREGSIGAGMRRIEALVGPDALREINVERALLRELVGALDAKDPHAATERARRIVEENRRLRNELGKLKAGDRDAMIDALAAGAADVDGVAVVTAEVPELDPGSLRELALKVRDRLQDRPVAVVVGNGANGKAMLVAAVNAAAVERGVAAPALLRDAASMVGGGAGGKDQLANAGGTKAEQVPAAIAAIPVRVHALVAGV
jgi:alanyl-tRNA synthetase